MDTSIIPIFQNGARSSRTIFITRCARSFRNRKLFDTCSVFLTKFQGKPDSLQMRLYHRFPFGLTVARQTASVFFCSRGAENAPFDWFRHCDIRAE